ncbi:MAG: copper resistance protein CopC [Acidobacteria bacterium]|nr:copper resistance protein CopC [Acidobacteriota bacterium]
MRAFCAALLLAGALLSSEGAYAQGCTQCRDNAAATPPATQLAYRHAIELLAGAAGLLFAGTVLILRRSR